MELQKELYPSDCTLCWVWTLNKLLHPSQQLVVSLVKWGQECLEITLRGLNKELSVFRLLPSPSLLSLPYNRPMNPR